MGTVALTAHAAATNAYGPYNISSLAILKSCSHDWLEWCNIK